MPPRSMNESNQFFKEDSMEAAYRELYLLIPREEKTSSLSWRSALPASKTPRQVDASCAGTRAASCHAFVPGCFPRTRSEQFAESTPRIEFLRRRPPVQ